MNPSREIIDFVSVNFLGKPFIAKGGPDKTDSFSCWSLVWHYENLCGLVLPYDPWEAVSQFVKVQDKPKWKDILSHKNFLMPIPHLGVLEMGGYVLHCNNREAGVVRDEFYFPPWDDADVWRHNSLL